MLQRIFPSPAAATLAIVGFAVEIAIASTATSHAIWAGGAATAVAIATPIWFWLTVAWAAHFAARAVARWTRGRARFARVAIGAGVLLVVAGVTIAYIASWGTFLQTRRFMNWEAVRFTLTNTRMLWLHLWDADSIQVLWLAIFTAVVLIAIPLLGAWLRRSAWRNGATERSRATRPIAWLLVSLVVMLLNMAVGDDLSLIRRHSRRDQLANCLNPVVTFASSAIDSFVQEPIAACLDTRELTPRENAAAAGSTFDASAPRPSVIVIAVESLRADVVNMKHQGVEVAPNINALARDGVHFTRAYAQSTHSDYADVCLASSLYPLRTRQHHFYRIDDPWPKALIHDVLKARGYATAIVSSQNEAWGNMDQFLATPGLDWFYHPQNSSAPSIVSSRDPGFAREHQAGGLLAGKFPDRHTTDMALDWIDARIDADEPFSLCLTFQSSHFPYLIPDDCPRPFQPCELDDDIKFSSYPKYKTPQVRNAYLNAVHESDRQIGRIIDRLRERSRLDDTILVVTGENGEAFHENGEVGHAGVPVEPAVHIAAVLHAPKWIEPRVEDYPFEHVDLAPTLFGLMGVSPHPNWQGIDALSPTRPQFEERFLFFHVNSPIARADAVQYAGRWKFMTTHQRPDGVLYDLENDPTESRDLRAERPELAAELRAVLARWRARQLAYYHFPMYYQRYYPPKAPNSDAPPKDHDGVDLAATTTR